MVQERRESQWCRRGGECKNREEAGVHGDRVAWRGAQHQWKEGSQGPDAGTKAVLEECAVPS